MARAQHHIMNNQAPRHVLFISDWYPHEGKPFDGIFIQKLAVCVQEQPNWQVSNISFHAHAGPLSVQESTYQGITEVRIYYPEKSPLLQRYLKLYNVIQASADRLADMHGPITLIQANIMPFAAAFAYRLARKHKVPWGIREGYSVYLDHSYRKFPLLKRRLTSWLINRADFVVAISTALADALQQYFPRIQPRIIANPIQDHTPQTRLPDTPPKLVAIADFYPYKNLDLLIQAFADVATTFSDWQLDLYGKGEEERRLRKLVKDYHLTDRIHFKGTVDNAVVYERLPDYQFLVISSSVETFSNVGIEALSCGVPVLATDCGGPSDFIHEENGLLVAPDSLSALSNGLATMMQKANSYDRAAIQSAVKNTYSMQSIGDQYSSLYLNYLQQ